MRLKKTTVSVIIILVALATITVMSGLNFIIPDTRKEADDNKYSEVQSPKIKQMENFFLTTKDGIKIATDLYPVENPVGWLVLVHMMPATKESWRDLAIKLQDLGYESLAIDLRGHGESDGGPNGFSAFSDAEHQKSILDLEAAVDYLTRIRRATPEKISFIGASIGANLSLQYISEHPEHKTAILLSPGLNYRGIKTEAMVKKLKAEQKVLFVSSRDDGLNAEQNQGLFDLTPTDVVKDLIIYQKAGHGTNMFGAGEEPNLEAKIIEFLKL